jgi:hypothetical protein
MRISRSGPALASLLMLLLAGPGCGKEHLQVSTDDSSVVSAELFHGECGGYCRRVTEVGADLQGRYRELPFSADPAYPPKERSFTVTEGEWGGVWAALLTAWEQTWQPGYGCPDCADQGGWKMTAEVAGERRTTTLDTRTTANPEALQRLIEAVVALDAQSR